MFEFLCSYSRVIYDNVYYTFKLYNLEYDKF